MTSTRSLVNLFQRRALTGVAVTLLAGCSTINDLSPFKSDVPYSQDVKPRMAQPANPEVPAFAPAPQPARKPVPAPPSGAPSGPQSSLAAPAGEKLAAASDLALVDDIAALDGVGDADGTEPAAEIPKGRPGHPVTMPPGQQAEIPARDLQFKDQGDYANLARVPARPPNMPTFLEVAAEKKTLLADRNAAKNPRPESPANPSPDSEPGPEAKTPAAPPPVAPVAVDARVEDRSPCLSADLVQGEPAAVVRFAPGSAALSSDDLAIIADAIPNVRAGDGPIRLFGHGDTDSTAPSQARFDLAAARAGAVAQALAGYGIPGQRIAIGVACADASVAGASVQLYAES